jgi:hypothetical protein
MTHVLRLTVFCLLALALPLRAHAQTAPILEAGIMFWKPTPELTLSTDGLTRAGVDEVDFVQEFGIEDKFFPEFRATLGRSHKLRVSFVSIKYDEETIIQRTFVFQGRQFTVGVPATADVKWDLWKFGYEWDFVSRDRGFFGVLVDLKYNKVEAAINSPLLTSAASTDTTAPVPTIGVAGRGYVTPIFAIGGEFTGFSLERDEFDASFFDFDVYGALYFGQNLGVQGGYRSVVVDYLVEEDSGNLKMKGPYIGAVVKF